ncbi:helix-turn-helix transcriptional regulator [Citrobacter amalonaticus]|nr:helix-turn-helix transcriptional regulator [Citrobacter amalonaticus]
MENIIDVAIEKKVGVSLPFFYFFYVTEGRVDFILKQSESVVIKKNEGLLLKPNISMDFDFSSMLEGQATINIIRIASDVVSKFNYLNYFRNGFDINNVNPSGLKKYNYCKFDFSNYIESEKDILKSLAVSIEHLNNSQFKKLGSRDDEVLFYEYTLLLEILSVNNSAVDSMFHDVTSETISERAARIVMSNYSQSWNVKSLAKKLSMSESTFKKKMYKEVGSVNEFINKLKIVESLRRLRRTTDSLTQISSDLGFCSSSYFTQVFTKHMGVLPSRIRDYFNSSSSHVD